MKISLSLSKEQWAAAAVFIVASYLYLFNLGYTPLWHDEAPLGGTAKNILLTGGYNGWDGRNLFTTGNAESVNSDLKLVAYPPWQALPSALGILIFGANEVGTRFFHALLGAASLAIFWLLLRLDFPSRPRLRLLAFTIFALSTQTILFMRLGRYVPDAIFFALLSFYMYRLYIGKGGQRRHLALAALAVTLGFLNHFGIGARVALALGVWHLLYYRRQTSRRQWIEMLAAGGACAGLCFFYLLAADIIFSDNKLEFQKFSYQWSWEKRHAALIYYNFRDLLRYGWLPLWVALWFVYFAARYFFAPPRNSSKNRKKSKKAAARQNGGAEDGAVIRWAVLLALFLFFSGLLEVRRVAIHPFADSRYIAPALAFTSLIIAACIDWVWRRKQGALFAAPLLAAVLLSNVPAFPYIHQNNFTGERARWLLPRLIAEIHRPYPTYTSDMVEYLNQHAAQDDTIFVEPWQDYAVLQFYMSEKLIFCCAIDEKTSGIPKETLRALGAPLYRGDVLPEWHVVVGNTVPDEREYELVYVSEKYGYPTQRPELEFHAFAPLAGSGHLRIYRRRR